jgi:hypothetical protein
MKYWFRKLKLVLLSIAFITLGLSCRQEWVYDPFYAGFQNPPAEARPFMRWWWNGNQVTQAEISRELQLLADAGIGGVEINPIAMPEEGQDVGMKSIEWLSPEWNNLVKHASTEARARGMITDLIVGSGWPFGGEFLQPDEMIQRVLVDKKKIQGPGIIHEDVEQLVEELAARHHDHGDAAVKNEILFVKLIPAELTSMQQVRDLTGEIDSSGILSADLYEGFYELIYGIRQTGHRKVMHGTLGAAGPVMDHYDQAVVWNYLERLKTIEKDTGVPLDSLVRALFCDSIELAGANWTDGFAETFKAAYGYELGTYLPFIFYAPNRGYEPENLTQNLKDELKRVRYDYNKLLVKVFLENFTRTFQKFCTENNVLCRYQAYGTPFLMGMLEGNMIPDIPESNNWIFSADITTDDWQWNKGHGYMIWNLYAAAGGHLKGRKIISCEAMTNLKGVFKMTLEDMKQADDMNFITGINHSVLHGFNYSPPEAGFPGWIRYGAYYNENNTWWPYFKKWADYNARLSYVFQQSQPVKQIAVLGPVADLWGDRGLIRVPFHMEPWYLYELWQSFSQSGSSVEYINERIIRDAGKEEGSLTFGPMSYQALLLGSVQTLEVETARAIDTYVKNGGKLILVDSLPDRSASLVNAVNGDQEVQEIFQRLVQEHPGQVRLMEAPDNSSGLINWTRNLMQSMELSSDMTIANPDQDVYQIHQRKGEQDIYFFINTHRKNPAMLEVSFPAEQGVLWQWNPEDGSRQRLVSLQKGQEVEINLDPLQSLLLILDPEDTTEVSNVLPQIAYREKPVEKPWQIRFEHVDGRTYEMESGQLPEFNTLPDSIAMDFAGTIIYKTNFTADAPVSAIQLEEVNRGITEVLINGQSAGVKWYGRHHYDLSGMVRQGQNDLEIRYTTVLANYVKNLQDNPTAERWTRGFEPVEFGVNGPVTLVLAPEQDKKLKGSL